MEENFIAIFTALILVMRSLALVHVDFYSEDRFLQIIIKKKKARLWKKGGHLFYVNERVQYLSYPPNKYRFFYFSDISSLSVNAKTELTGEREKGMEVKRIVRPTNCWLVESRGLFNIATAAAIYRGCFLLVWFIWVELFRADAAESVALDCYLLLLLKPWIIVETDRLSRHERRIEDDIEHRRIESIAHLNEMRTGWRSSPSCPQQIPARRYFEFPPPEVCLLFAECEWCVFIYLVASLL